MMLRLIQVVLALNTLLLIVSIYWVKNGKIKQHRAANLYVILSTYAGAIGLVATVLMGWDYSGMTTPFRLLVHRFFSVGLFLTLLPTGIFGYYNYQKLHKLTVMAVTPFWLGTLITGLIFF